MQTCSTTAEESQWRLVGATELAAPSSLTYDAEARAWIVGGAGCLELRGTTPDTLLGIHPYLFCLPLCLSCTLQLRAFGRVTEGPLTQNSTTFPASLFLPHLCFSLFLSFSLYLSVSLFPPVSLFFSPSLSLVCKRETYEKKVRNEKSKTQRGELTERERERGSVCANHRHAVLNICCCLAWLQPPCRG